MYAMENERVLPWSTLEKFVYYYVEKVEYFTSKFRDGLVAVVTINNLKYYFPVGMMSVLEHFKGSKFIIFPGEKSLCPSTSHLTWDIAFYKNIHMVMVNDYEDVKARLKTRLKCEECELTPYGLGPENQLGHTCVQRLETIGANYKDVFLEEIILEDSKYKHLPPVILCSRFRYMDNSVNINQVSGIFIIFSYIFIYIYKSI